MEAADGRRQWGSGDGLKAVGDGGWHAAARQLAAPRRIPLRMACPFGMVVKLATEDGDLAMRLLRAAAEVFRSRWRRPFGRRWPKRHRRILGKETAGLGGGGIVCSGVWQKRLGVRAEDFSGGGGGPRGSVEPRRWWPECRCKVRSEEADPVGGGCPRGGRCLRVRVEEIFLDGGCRDLRRRPLGQRRAGNPGGKEDPEDGGGPRGGRGLGI
uniref:Uncharacterized protein n=1 Tax=Oryza meridionalis TaxID=40149 RepID=A0A0E0DQ80_9ORYZ